MIKVIVLFLIVSINLWGNKYVNMTNIHNISYNCKNNDFKCLKKYIKNLSRKMGNNDHYLDIPTIENTSFLRSLVHNINFHYKVKARPKQRYHSSTGYMFKKKVGDNCGFIAQTLFDIYKALGYKTLRHSQIDGVYKDPKYLKFRDGHVFTEVYIPKLKKYIIQDATFNSIVTLCNSNIPLSLQEIKKLSLSSSKCLDINAGIIHSNYRKNGRLTRKDIVSIIDDYYVSLPYTILSKNKYFTFEDTYLSSSSNFNDISKTKQHIKDTINKCNIKRKDKTVPLKKLKCLEKNIIFPFYYVQGINTMLFGFRQGTVPYIIDFFNSDIKSGGVMYTYSFYHFQYLLINGFLEKNIDYLDMLQIYIKDKKTVLYKFDSYNTKDENEK